MSNNAFDNIQDALEGLLSLPSLKELYIDVQSKDDETLLLQALPKLQVLNGNRIHEYVNNNNNIENKGI